LVEKLNEFKIGGFPLGFWIAQQGSIIVFIFLVLIYALLMAKIDREYSKQESKEEVSS
jgi:putative solute:sodium symporter small subunit